MLKVLIVDDDKLVRKGLIATMPWSDFGMCVIGEASNGQRAYEFIEQHEVDLLITDLAMPVMSGIDLMRKLAHSYPHIWMVVLTFHQDFETVQEALRIGAIDYVAKVQLEQEEAEEVLGRISRRIIQERERDQQKRFNDPFNEKTGNPSAGGLSNGTHSPVSDPDLSAVRASWSSLLWIVNEPVFHDYVAELRRMRLPAPMLASLFQEAVWEWSRIVPEHLVEPNAPLYTLESWADWEQWLRTARKQLRGALLKSYSGEVTQCILKAVSFINRNLCDELRVADAAREAAMSRSYFSLCFKDIIGKSFHDYVRDARIANARMMLKQTANPIYWVAQKCGYPNEKYFTRVFREQIGMLPSEYRMVED